MNTYVITFSRVGIRDGWVEVQARDEEIARTWALKEYGTCWANIYTPSQWEPRKEDWFPLGCIGQTTLHYEAAEHIR